ncbi:MULTISPECIES: hypothetical protein [unclassified Streptomyces]|uniref:hypothetical protein n=1 Tax=unclassified Streptomyces TaxID=2593676 RepID=UPI00363413AD
MTGGQSQSRWGYQLGVLRRGLDQLDLLDEQWHALRDALPAGCRPGTEAYDGALADHHADCWAYLDDWVSHSHILREIDTAARQAPSPLGPPQAALPAPATARTTPVRR